jgi:hypothetical protein
MTEDEAAVALANATVRWFAAGQAQDAMVRKLNASAMGSLINGGKQDRHEEEAKFFHAEYKAAQKGLHEMLAEYVRIAPESVPDYPRIMVTAAQQSTIQTMDWLAAITNGAMKL